MIAAYPNLIKDGVKRFLLAQSVLLLIACLLAAFFPVFGGVEATFCGGGTIWVANACCVRLVSRSAGGQQSPLHWKRFLRAHGLKWVITAIGLAWCFKASLSAAGVVFGLLMVQGVYWFSPFIFKEQVRTRP